MSWKTERQKMLHCLQTSETTQIGSKHKAANSKQLYNHETCVLAWYQVRKYHLNTHWLHQISFWQTIDSGKSTAARFWISCTRSLQVGQVMIHPPSWSDTNLVGTLQDQIGFLTWLKFSTNSFDECQSSFLQQDPCTTFFSLVSLQKLTTYCWWQEITEVDSELCIAFLCVFHMLWMKRGRSIWIPLCLSCEDSIFTEKEAQSKLSPIVIPNHHSWPDHSLTRYLQLYLLFPFFKHL